MSTRKKPRADITVYASLIGAPGIEKKTKGVLKKSKEKVNGELLNIGNEEEKAKGRDAQVQSRYRLYRFVGPLTPLDFVPNKITRPAG